MYKLRYTYLKFRGHQLGFSTSGFLPFGRTTMPLCLLDSWIPKTEVAVGISLPFCVHAEIYVFEVLRPPSWFFTSGDLLISDYHQYNTSGMSAAENVVLSLELCS